MLRLVKLMLIIVFLAASCPAFPVLALDDINITNAEVYSIADGRARLKWDTFKVATKAVVYWGENPQDLNRYIGYGLFDYRHEVVLTGLQKDATYYYKIVSFDKLQRKTESFMQTFSTKKMLDTIAPEILERKIIQTTRDAAVLYWRTNEDTKAKITYGTSSNNLNKKASYKSFKKEHELFLYKLDTDQKYYVKITAEDKGKNKKSRVFTFRTGTYLDKNTEISIYGIEPLNFDSELIGADEVTIKWKTNFIAKSKIHYGKQTAKYDKHISVNGGLRKTEHSIILTELEPSTTYYYKIEVYDALYKKKAKSKELSFTTTKYADIVEPQIEIVDQPIDYFDSDDDNLSDGYELEIGTDPFAWDSDGDGYDDGNEMRHGWDPLVPGSTPDTKLQPERYFKPKLAIDIEQIKSQNLRSMLTKQLGKVNVSEKNWKTLLNAYAYGEYPVEAIAQAIRFGGKTVHPRIGWNSWKNSGQYLEYIGK